MDYIKVICDRLNIVIDNKVFEFKIDDVDYNSINYLTLYVNKISEFIYENSLKDIDFAIIKKCATDLIINELKRD